MRSAQAWLALTVVATAAWPCAAAEVLLAADPDLRAPLSRALGDADLTPVPEAPPEAPARTATLLDEAARAYAAMDAARALVLLADARTELDRSGGGQDGPLPTVRLALLDALALQAAGRQGEVDDALSRALAAAPDLTVDPVEYPPWLRARVDALRQTPRALATLELRGAPGADAWIDGAAACVLPCARELPIGAHRVRVVRSGRRPFSTLVSLTASLALEVALSPDVAALAEDARAAAAAGRAPDEALTAFATVVWASVRQGASGARVVQGALYSADAPRRTASAPLAGSDAASVERACRALVSALTAPAVTADPRGAGRPTRRRPRATPWFEQPWIWIAAGAVAIAGGVGIAVAAAPAEDGFVPVWKR